MYVDQLWLREELLVTNFQGKVTFPGLFSAVHKTHSVLIHIRPAKMAGLVELDVLSVPGQHQLPVGGRAHHTELEVFQPATSLSDVQKGKIQWLHRTNGKGERTIHVKSRRRHFASTCFVSVGEARNAAGNTKAALQKEALLTPLTPVPAATPQACPRTGCALATCAICKVPLPAFLNTLGFRQEIGLFTACTLMGALALETVVATALAEAHVPVERRRALLRAGPVLQDVAVHALQAVCPQRPAARVATPVALSAYPGGEVQIVLWGAALILTFPEEQDLVWVSAGGTAGLGITASTVLAAWLTSTAVIEIVPGEAGRAAGAKVGQNEVGIARGAREGSCALAGSAGGVTFFTSSSLREVSRGTIRNTVVPQQQVPGILAAQADAACVLEVRGAALAQGVAVGAVAHQVQELLFLAAGPAAPASKSDMRVTGSAVSFRRAVALPAGGVAFGAPAFLVKVTVWAPRETLAVQQHLGRLAGCAVMWALPSTPETGLVASFAQPRVLQVKLGSTLRHTLARGDVRARQLRNLQAFPGLLTPDTVSGFWTQTSEARGMTGFAEPVVRVEALSTAGQAVALTQSPGLDAGCAVGARGSRAAGTRIVTSSASASGLSIVPMGAFSNAFPIMQYCLLSTGKTPGTIGATTLTGLVTRAADSLPVVEPEATAAVTDALPQHVERVSAG